MGMTAYCKRIVDFLGCEYEYFESTAGDEIYARYKALAAQGKEEGFTPLIVIPTDVLAEMFGFISEKNPDAAAWRTRAIAASAGIDAKAFLLEEQAQLESEYGADLMLELGDFCPSEGRQRPMMCGLVPPVEEALIVKAPTQNPWELAVWLPMGGFNDCPASGGMAAVFRHWYEQYGAVPTVLMGHDTWELELTRPPQGDEACEALAKEHFTFCFDLTAFTESTREYASSLRRSTVWQFWWD